MSKTIQDVLTGLEKEGFTIQATEAVSATRETRWYMQGLLGCGGWLAAVFFFVFSGWCLVLTLGGMSEESQALAAMVLGVLIMGGTIYRRRVESNIFWQQALLACQIAGQLLFAFGLTIFIGTVTQWQSYPFSFFALCIIALEIIAIVFYGDAILRFLATLVIVAALNFIVYDLNLVGGLSILIAGLALLTLVIWTNILSAEIEIRFYTLLQAVGYAIVLGLIGTIIFELSLPYYEFEWSRAAISQALLTTCALTVLLLWLEYRLLADYDIPPTSPISLSLFILTLLIALITWTSSGVIAGISLLVVGFRRKNAMLTGYAYLCLTAFISYYYYNLQTTLLVKSLILITIGLVLLGTRLLYRRFFDTMMKEATV